MNLPSKETGVKATGDAKHFSPDSETGLFGNQTNTKKQALIISSSRENCAFLHAPSLRLDNSRIRELAIIRRLRLPAHSKRSAGLQPRKLAPRFGVRPLPPLKTAFQVCARVEGGEFAGEPPPGSL